MACSMLACPAGRWRPAAAGATGRREPARVDPFMTFMPASSSSLLSSIASPSMLTWNHVPCILRCTIRCCVVGLNDSLLAIPRPCLLSRVPTPQRCFDRWVKSACLNTVDSLEPYLSDQQAGPSPYFAALYFVFCTQVPYFEGPL
jgi:hypothetical protein